MCDRLCWYNLEKSVRLSHGQLKGSSQRTEGPRPAAMEYERAFGLVIGSGEKPDGTRPETHGKGRCVADELIDSLTTFATILVSVAVSALTRVCLLPSECLLRRQLYCRQTIGYNMLRKETVMGNALTWLDGALTTCGEQQVIIQEQGIGFVGQSRDMTLSRWILSMDTLLFSHSTTLSVFVDFCQWSRRDGASRA